MLIARKRTVAVAESCTGGLLSEMFTRLPGSSEYFLLGVTVYSNGSKTKILGIPERLIAKKGAVSEETAGFMARAVRKLVSSDFGIGITGIAGPGGGTTKKPVGTVYIAIDAKNNALCRKLCFTGSRSAIRKKAALKTLELLKTFI